MKRRFSAEELFELRNSIPINVLIEELLKIPCKTSEGYFRFLCPICNEYRTATKCSSNLARCFGCEKNFNTIDLTMAVKASGFIESVNYLKGVLNRASKLKEIVSGIGRAIDGRR